MGVFNCVLFVCFPVFLISSFSCKNQEAIKAFYNWCMVCNNFCRYHIPGISTNNKTKRFHSALIPGSCYIVWTFSRWRIRCAAFLSRNMGIPGCNIFQQEFCKLLVDLVWSCGAHLGELHNGRCSFYSRCCCRFLYFLNNYLPAENMELHTVAIGTSLK